MKKKKIIVSKTELWKHGAVFHITLCVSKMYINLIRMYVNLNTADRA